MPTKPKAGESKSDFISRCVPIVMGEGKTQDQALGKCYGMYREYKSAEKSLIEKIKKSVKDLHGVIKNYYGSRSK